MVTKRFKLFYFKYVVNTIAQQFNNREGSHEKFICSRVSDEFFLHIWGGEVKCFTFMEHFNLSYDNILKIF